MTTDNRTNEQLSGNTGQFTEAQVEAAALAMHRDTGPRGGYGWTEYLSQARAALVAAQGAARPVNGFDTTAERVKTGGDSLHVAPQEPNQNETKSGNNFVSLDPEKVAAIIWDLVDVSPERQDLLARALCEAYTEGKLT